MITSLFCFILLIFSSFVGFQQHNRCRLNYQTSEQFRRWSSLSVESVPFLCGADLKNILQGLMDLSDIIVDRVHCLQGHAENTQIRSIVDSCNMLLYTNKLMGVACYSHCRYCGRICIFLVDCCFTISLYRVHVVCCGACI